MSRIQRAVAKAEREGLLTWTAGDDRRRTTAFAPAPEIPPAATERFTPEVAWTPTIGAPTGDAPFVDPSEAAISPLFVAATQPGSAPAEQYRLLRTRLESRDRGRRAQMLVVTSPGAGDGKTVTSANLALTMAQEFNHTVVLVEADMRRPALANLCGVRAEPGLVDVLIGAASLEEALVSLPEHNLFILPAGAAAGRSSELLASSAMSQLADALRGRFDRIVIDTPPMMLADTHVLARLADGVLMVVRSGVTPKPALEQALAGLERERLIGIVMNDVDAAPGAYTYGADASEGGA